jgi:hypothetical protein
MAQLDPQVPQAHQAQMEAPARKDPKAHLAQPDHQATMVPQETRDRQAQMDPRASLVFAPNTAPPMAVSSSKMEQDDKHHFTLSTPPSLQFAPADKIDFPWFLKSPMIVILLASMTWRSSGNIS